MWSDYKIFWPPRLIKSLKEKNLTCFFGAGLSLPCGLPSWDSLLKDSLGVGKEFLEDDSARNDPLTQAELASHKIGTEKVQDLIRQSVNITNKPSYNHFLLVLLDLEFYITSNYDNLFENAWDILHPGDPLITILNDSDLYTYFKDGEIDSPVNANKHYLFKMHGCAMKKEQLILTRSDYRRHYRTNKAFFHAIEENIFAKRHMLFLGFSHKDPEISRLVEDTIYLWEKDKENNLQPNFYSLQFDMTNYTPEIFAARGIVALSPPIMIPSNSSIDIRSYGLAHALIDLHAMSEYVDISTMSLEDDMNNYFYEIESEMNGALDTLSTYEQNAKDVLNGTSDDHSWLKKLSNELEHFAGQGVYLLNRDGTIVCYDIEKDLIATRKDQIEDRASFSDRPYFQQARTFREKFISDVYPSIFNELSTFSICFPIKSDENIFIGLLFSACQIGQWQTPVKLAKNIQYQKRAVLLVDSNGICLLPPNDEFAYETSPCSNGESRIGFIYNDLLVISRRDKLVSRIMENLIPLGQDDDVLSLSSDLKYYSIVKEIPFSRWKLTISSRVVLSK